MTRRLVELSIAQDRLSCDASRRRDELHAYFPDRRIHDLVENGDHYRILLGPPPSCDYYVDPRLEEGLRWWDPNQAIQDIPYTYRRTNGVFQSLSDAWTLLSWSEWLSRQGTCPGQVVIVHVDDHDDLMSPRLGTRADGFIDLLTGATVNAADPATVTAAITSGAVGMGSFMVPFLHTVARVDVRHICDTGYAVSRAQQHMIENVTVPDTLLATGRPRPAITLIPMAPHDLMSGTAVSTYRAGNDASSLLADLPDAPILLHIDLDYFNNRFNWDSYWAEHSPRHDPPLERIKVRMDALLTALNRIRDRVVDVAIGVSPGFFPAEYWETVGNELIQELAAASGS